MTVPEKLNGSLAMSVLLHAGLFSVVLFAPALFPMGAVENWGSASAGEGMNVNLVGSLPGMALPAPEVKTEDAAANDSKGFYKEEPAPPAPPPPVEKAVPIPDKSAKTSKAPAAAEKRPAAKAAPPVPDIPSNAVPYGKGGNPDVGYGGPTIGSGPGGVAGLGDAAFGSKYAGYVDAMKRRISQNWLKGLVDSSQVRGTPRVYMSFDIERDGRITNIEMKQSSNFPSLDNSARRALAASSPLQPLPSDYLGSRVSVTFYFEYVK